MVMLAVWSLVLLIHPDPNDTEVYGPSVIAVYRAVGLCLIEVWLWGGNIYIWTKYRVNYVYVCEFNPQTRLTHFQVFEEAAGLSIVFLANALLYLYNFDLGLTRLVYPAALFLYMLLKLFAPVRPFSLWSSRSFLLESLYHIVTSPFGRVRFFEIYLADV